MPKNQTMGNSVYRSRKWNVSGYFAIFDAS